MNSGVVKEFEEIKEKSKKENIRVLVLCHFCSAFVKDFLESMKKSYDFQFDILTMDKSYNTNVENGVLENVYVYSNLAELVNYLNSKEQYDIIHIHFLTPAYGYIADFISKKCKKLIVSVWGSDFYRTTSQEKNIQNNVLKQANNITFGNEKTMTQFIKYYGEEYRDKTKIARFGLKVLEDIEKLRDFKKDNIKKDMNIPKGDIIVTCGYSASPAHNHIGIIKSISKFKDKLPENICLLFPMTYGGGRDYIQKVKEQLENNNFKYKLYDSFLSSDCIAKIRKISDIMIQVQSTDQLSGSMQEHLYCNNVVITGAWLPYDILKEREVFFMEVESVDKVGLQVAYAIENLETLKEKCKGNKEKISKLSLWENTVKDWNEVYNLGR